MVRRRDLDDLRVDPLRGKVLRKLDEVSIFPGPLRHARRPATPAMAGIKEELRERLVQLKAANKLVEEQRLRNGPSTTSKCGADGRCKGIQNCSAPPGRAPEEPPPTLLTTTSRKIFYVRGRIHETVPQVGAMFKAIVRARRDAGRLGFRLPSAMDNRPPASTSGRPATGQTIFVSATPAEFELQRAQGVVVDRSFAHAFGIR